MAALIVARGFDEPWAPHEAPDWFWKLADLGTALLHRGASGQELANRIRQEVVDRDSEQFGEDMDLITNHLRRTWYIEEKYSSCLPRTRPEEDHALTHEEDEFVEQAVHTLHTLWLREKHSPHAPDQGAEANDTDNTTSSRPRSRTPSRSMTTTNTEVMEETCLMDKTPGEVPLRKRSPTRLWKELPAHKKTAEVRKLTPPWKRNNNPPLQQRGEPREPSRSPPRAPPKPKPMPTNRCDKKPPAETDVPAPHTPPQDLQAEPAEAQDLQAEPAEERPLTREDAMAVWQGLLEMQPNEGLEAAAMPLLPQHVADNIVETLVDRPAHEHELLVDELPTFLGRLQIDLGRALARSRDLRATMQGAGSSTDPPPADQEDDDSIYMQTNMAMIDKEEHPTRLLQELQLAFEQLEETTASSRAIRMAAKLQDHEGPLCVNRNDLEALLVSFSTETPSQPTGDAAILEFGWVGRWWRRMQGEPEEDRNQFDYDIEVFEQHVRNAGEIKEAEEAHQDAAEQLYLRGLEEAAQVHCEQLKAQMCQQEDDETMRQAMGMTWRPAAKRLCVGIAITDGVTVKAFDWELDKGAELQLHLKATKRECPGQWYKDGKPVPPHQVPRNLHAPLADTKPAEPKPPTQHDLAKLATKELYERWKRGEVSDQAVVRISSTDMLAVFQATRDIPAEVMHELDNRDTFTLQPMAVHTLETTTEHNDTHDSSATSSTAHTAPLHALQELVPREQQRHGGTRDAPGTASLETNNMDPGVLADPGQANQGQGDLHAQLPLDHEAPPGPAIPDSPAPDVNSDEMDDVHSNPSTYYNGAKWYAKYGSTNTSSGKSDKSD